jgi:NADPH-dependent curcumin reductase
MDTLNRQFRLAARPVGLPKDNDWELVTEPVRDPAEGEVVVAAQYISLDPAMRGWVTDRRSYVPPVAIGEVMRALAGGRVVASKHAEIEVGDHITGVLGVQEYAVMDGGALTKVDTSQAPLPVFLSTLGMTGMTAYFGLLDVGKPQAGETVVVSGAGGAVGGLVGEIAKLKGCRAIGIAGGREKCRHVVEELGFDAAIDYRSDNVGAQLRRHCPDGVDVYFDNVGGDVLDAALANLARHARVVICGAISQYNNTGPTTGPVNYLSLLVNRASMTGFLVSDYHSRFPEATRDMADWLAAGKVTSREDIAEGFENFPATLNRLFSGENTGKLVLKVSPRDD